MQSVDKYALLEVNELEDQYPNKVSTPLFHSILFSIIVMLKEGQIDYLPFHC